MEITIPKKWVLFARHTLSSPMDIGVHASKDEPKLRLQAESLGLNVAGPLEHAYSNMAVKGVPHILEIWLPVEQPAPSMSIENLKTVESFRCLTTRFKRPIEEIGDGWMELGEQGRKLGFTSTHQDREVYNVMDCDNPANNDIELQLGIQ